MQSNRKPFLDISIDTQDLQPDKRAFHDLNCEASRLVNAGTREDVEALMADHITALISQGASRDALFGHMALLIQLRQGAKLRGPKKHGRRRGSTLVTPEEFAELEHK